MWKDSLNILPIFWPQLFTKRKNNSPGSSWLLAEHREKAGICCAAELGSLGLTLLRNLLPPWDLGLSSYYGCLESLEVLSEIFMLRGDRNKTWSLAWTSSTISEASRFPSAALARAVGSIYNFVTWGSKQKILTCNCFGCLHYCFCCNVSTHRPVDHSCREKRNCAY